MTDFYEYYVNEQLDRRRAVNAARRYSARCRIKRQRRNYAIAVAVGLFLAFCYFGWQITRPESEPVLSAPTAQQYSEVSEPVIREPVVSAYLKPLGEFSLTAYCSCENCCGQWALNRPLDENGNEIVYTASGEIARAGVTVAVDPRIIPLGTQICIGDLGLYTAQDTGNFGGNVIDIYFDSHDAAVEFGLRKNIKVWEVLHDGVSS